MGKSVCVTWGYSLAKNTGVSRNVLNVLGGGLKWKG